MMNNNRGTVRARRIPALAELPLCLALAVASCSGGSGGAGGSQSGGATGTGGAASGGASSTGGSASGGVSGSGGAGSGGALNTGGAASGGALNSGGSASGGTPGSGGAAKGGETGAGGGAAPDASIGSGGSTSKGGAGGGAAGGASGGTNGGGSSGTSTMPTGTPVPSPGCGKTSTVTFGAVPGESGTSVGTGKGGYVTVNGRGFAMRLPDNYDNNKPYWLFFGFHWNGGNSKEVDTGGSNGYQMAHFGLQKLSNNGAFFVAPDGLNAGWGGNNLPFVDDMVKLITENYCIDMSRLYANGFSYGGGMSYAIACARAKVFRAVAIYEGAQLSGCEGGNDPIAYWQMAGTTDGTCTIDMGKGLRDKFVKNNGCTGPTTEPPRPSSISQPHICTDYTGCSSGHPLRWCVHPAGHGNAIVDGTADLYNSCATPPKTCSDSCKCTWVPEDVWKFFTSL